MTDSPDTIAAALATIPGASGTLARLRAAGVPEAPRVTTETPDEAAARHAIYDARRVARWERDRPQRYATAAYADLDPAQHRDAIAGWWESAPLNLILAGATGAGKTHAAYAVGNDVVARGGRVIAMTVADYCAALRPSQVEPTRASETVVAAAKCDLLILDDLGRESMSEFVRERIHEVIDVRGRTFRRTLVTTNLGPEPTIDRYGSQVFDRLDGDGVALPFAGPSRRRSTWA